MKLMVKYFGLLADITKQNEESFSFEDDLKISKLKSIIENRYPEIIHQNYVFAVNQKITQEDALLNDHDEIALLPPFAGG